ncbi:hypothetical protein PR048_028334 [Dryococelus australis]|uniref:Uncharacterized protein n=1 Tax=Dryococelus australis TaxID=614101 RepID=A0ABQ9GIZ0_9NEOP|nr:hypothetical protein PR048_028334 [Dryococelus australis]
MLWAYITGIQYIRKVFNSIGNTELLGIVVQAVGIHYGHTIHKQGIQQYKEFRGLPVTTLGEDVCEVWTLTKLMLLFCLLTPRLPLAAVALPALAYGGPNECKKSIFVCLVNCARMCLEDALWVGVSMLYLGWCRCDAELLCLTKDVCLISTLPSYPSSTTQPYTPSSTSSVVVDLRKDNTFAEADNSHLRVNIYSPNVLCAVIAATANCKSKNTSRRRTGELTAVSGGSPRWRGSRILNQQPITAHLVGENRFGCVVGEVGCQTLQRALGREKGGVYVVHLQLVERTSDVYVSSDDSHLAPVPLRRWLLATLTANATHDCGITLRFCSATTYYATSRGIIRLKQLRAVTANGTHDCGITLRFCSATTYYATSRGIIRLKQLRAVTANGTHDCGITLRFCSATTYDATSRGIIRLKQLRAVTANGTHDCGITLRFCSATTYDATSRGIIRLKQLRAVTANGTHDCGITLRFCSATTYDATSRGIIRLKQLRAVTDKTLMLRNSHSVLNDGYITRGSYDWQGIVIKCIKDIAQFIALIDNFMIMEITRKRITDRGKIAENAMGKFVYTAIDAWIKKYPGRNITIHDIRELVSNTLPQAATPKNIVAGFSATRIWPYNENVFDDPSLYFVKLQKDQALTWSQQARAKWRGHWEICEAAAVVRQCMVMPRNHDSEPGAKVPIGRHFRFRTSKNRSFSHKIGTYDHEIISNMFLDARATHSKTCSTGSLQVQSSLPVPEDCSGNIQIFMQVFTLPTRIHSENEDIFDESGHYRLFPNTVSLLEEENCLRFENVYLYTKSLQRSKYQRLARVLQAVEGLSYFPSSDNEAIVPPSEALSNSIFVFYDIAARNKLAFKITLAWDDTRIIQRYVFLVLETRVRISVFVKSCLLHKGRYSRGFDQFIAVCREGSSTGNQQVMSSIPPATSMGTVSTINAKDEMSAVHPVCAEVGSEVDHKDSIDVDYDGSDNVEDYDHSLDIPTHFTNDFPFASDVKKAEDAASTDYMFTEYHNKLVD